MSDLRQSIIASAEIDGARVEIVPGRNVWLDIRVNGLKSRALAHSVC